LVSPFNFSIFFRGTDYEDEVGRCPSYKLRNALLNIFIVGTFFFLWVALKFDDGWDENAAICFLFLD
jgi:hypothetical protein